MDGVAVSARSLRTDLAAHLGTVGDVPPCEGRGIVTCAGGLRYNTCGWVLIKMLRELGCTLPIEVWYLGEKERDPAWIELVEPLGVHCRSVERQAPQSTHARAHGWSSKSYAIRHSAFAEVLFLDADNLPIVDPTFLFDEPEYLRTGAVFWPDGGMSSPTHPLWDMLGLGPRAEREFESGQMLIDKQRCWRALAIADWFNRQADFFYRYLYGDKDTFRLAWHVAGQEFAMPKHELVGLRGTLCQYDFRGQRILQHRCYPKWSLYRNPSIGGCERQPEAIAFLAELRERWNPIQRFLPETNGEATAHSTGSAANGARPAAAGLFGKRFRVIDRAVRRGRVELAEANRAHFHPYYPDTYWWPDCEALLLLLADRALPFRLMPQAGGRWLAHEPPAEPSVQLIPA